MASKTLTFVLSIVIWSISSADHSDPNVVSGRSVAVHLFEWKWRDIEEECKTFLGPNGFAAVQVSPPNEHAVVQDPWRPWWESYQPVSYKLESRRGNRGEFVSMVKTCNKQGVRIYVDAVINHMAGNNGDGKGSGGSSYNVGALQFSAVPYGPNDFNGPDNCQTGSGNIERYDDVNQVRNCRLVGLPDLRLSNSYVLDRLADFLNDLISVGVAGFRFDAAKHMWPGDIAAVLRRVRNLPADHGFREGARPFVYQEVIDMGGEPIKKQDYIANGRVTEFKYGIFMGQFGRRHTQLKHFRSFGPSWGLLPSDSAWVFVDNHDNQRGHGGGGAVLTHTDAGPYKMANAFMMAFPYGFPKIMSSFTSPVGITGSNNWVGPPANGDGSIRDVVINSDGTCGDFRICEHRWRQIKNMVAWRNAAGFEPMKNWWDNGGDQISFSRGDRAFVAFNNEGYTLDRKLTTGLAPGDYCDVVSGDATKTGCSGTVVTVEADGAARILVPSSGNSNSDSFLAIHIHARSGSGDIDGGSGGGGSSGGCAKPIDKRVECGWFGIQEFQCQDRGCCWKPTTHDGIPWCFRK